MDSEIFDYGGDDSSTEQTGAPNELSDIFGSAESKPRQSLNRPGAGLDLRVTVQAVVAVILITVAGGLLVRDAWARRVRDTAFRQMIEANSRREYLHIIEGAENFLTHKPLNGGSDAREGNVVSLYSEALVHWTAQQPGKLDTNVLARIARYKRLVKSPDK